MATRQQLFSPVNAFIQGRQARQQEDYGESRNALAQMEVEQAPRDIANRNALAERQQKQFTDQDRQANTEWMAGASQQVLALPADQQPQAAAAMFEEGKRRGIVQPGAQMPPFDPQKLQQFVADAKVRLGQAPAAPIESRSVGGMNVLTQDGKYLNAHAPKTADDSYTLSPGQQRYEGGKRVASVAPTEPTAKDERLVQISDETGNPKWVRESDAVGKRAYTPRDKPVADLKFQREIRAKQPRLQAAIRRVDRLSEAAKGISQIPGFDGGPIDQYVIGWTKAAQELKQAAASLTPELTALTRVPGIGSQSDLETRLAGLQFPSTEFAPEVNEKAVAELQAFMKDLQDVYGSVEAEFQSAEVESLLDKYAPQK